MRDIEADGRIEHASHGQCTRRDRATVEGDSPGAGRRGARRPVALAYGGAVIPDIDSRAILSVMLEIANPSDGAAEVLAVDSGATVITVDATAPGRLLLRGPVPAAAFQRVLATLTYENTRTKPSPGTRKVRVFLETRPGRA